MILDSAALQDLTEDHLNSLIRQQESEDGRNEYKSDLRLSSPAEKREFCKDVSAMANSLGGHIFFGIHESNGVAVSLAGIEYCEALDQQVNQILTSGIAPRIWSISTHPVRLCSGRHVLVLRIDVDGNLHQVRYDDNRYYRRVGTITVPMDSSDIGHFLSMGPRSKERAEDVISRYYATLRDGRYFKEPQNRAMYTICIVPVKGGGKVRRVAGQNCGTPALCTPPDTGCQLFPIHFFDTSSGPGSSGSVEVLLSGWEPPGWRRCCDSRSR